MATSERGCSFGEMFLSKGISLVLGMFIELGHLNNRNLDLTKFSLWWLNHKSVSCMLIFSKFYMSAYQTHFAECGYFQEACSVGVGVGRVKLLGTASSNSLPREFIIMTNVFTSFKTTFNIRWSDDKSPRRSLLILYS